MVRSLMLKKLAASLTVISPFGAAAPNRSRARLTFSSIFLARVKSADASVEGSANRQAGQQLLDGGRCVLGHGPLSCCTEEGAIDMIESPEIGSL